MAVLKTYRLKDRRLQHSLSRTYVSFSYRLSVAKNADPEAEYVKVSVLAKNPDNKLSNRQHVPKGYPAPLGAKRYTFYFHKSEVLENAEV